MNKLLVAVTMLVSGCGAQIQREAGDDAGVDAAVDTHDVGTSSVVPPPILDSGHLEDTRPVDTAPDPSFGCSAEKAPRTCWKCCENVPSLRTGSDAYFRDVLPCLCKLPTLEAGCADTCAKIGATPYVECSPWLQAHATECLEGVKAGDQKAVDAFLACTATCPTSF
ncbi:MAG: hypothetical protein IPJ34_33740 [Myxococcales bacterium]|nr:hypothetical protein [Myxococcales bacterium]